MILRHTPSHIHFFKFISAISFDWILKSKSIRWKRTNMSKAWWRLSNGFAETSSVWWCFFTTSWPALRIYTKQPMSIWWVKHYVWFMFQFASLWLLMRLTIYSNFYPFALSVLWYVGLCFRLFYWEYRGFIFSYINSLYINIFPVFYF